ncbi:MAG: NAD(+) synthase [Clostridia bacterium]|nr:NAD(+) synthase [Clostridia bacterium]
MKDGFIRVAAAVPSIRIADCPHNTEELIRIAHEASANAARVLVFPELCVTAYTCGDLFFSRALLTSAEAALAEYLQGTADLPMLSVIGLPLIWQNKLYNCAAVCASGKLLGIVPKRNLPNYAEHSEQRYFTPAPDGMHHITVGGTEVPFGTKQLFCCDTMPELQVAVEICEDLWTPLPPSCVHTAAGATVVLNLSAGAEFIGKAAYRRRLIETHSARLLTGYVYANAGYGESSTDLVFSGHCLIGENGILAAERPPFTEPADACVFAELDISSLVRERIRLNTYPAADNPSAYLHTPFTLPLTETPLSRNIDPHPFVPADKTELAERCETILTIAAHGLRQRIERAFARSCIVAVSGGLDSCLALLTTVRAMDMLSRPRSEVIAVTMPCFGTTKRTKSNAEKLCAELGVTLRTIDITDAVNLHFRDIGHDPDDRNVVYENSQARERTQIIMDIANAENGLVIGTGDLSELALGWATYNGDHMSMYAVNSSIPKTLIRHIVAHCAECAEREGQASLTACLRDILATPVSPELLPPKNGEIAQITEDLVGPYELHDFYLYLMLRRGYSPRKIFRLARMAFRDVYDDETILHWLEIFIRRFISQQFKRSCLPDGPKVGSVGISPRGDLCMPSDASGAVWLDELAACRDMVAQK